MEQPPDLMNITTEQIQKCLDENKELILAIMEYYNQGKLAESEPFRARLQQNLMDLAKIADAQAHAQAQAQASKSSQMQQHQHVQSAQTAMVKQHPSVLAPKFPFHSSDQQQQLNQPQVGLGSGGPSVAYQGIQTGFGDNFVNTQDDVVEEIQNSAYGQRQG